MPYYKSADGTRLAYTDAGKGRPTLVFIHGWNSNSHHWDPQARAFSRRHRVIRVDRRGHGRSEAPARGYRPREQADELAALLRARRVRSAVVIGHAGGAATTLELTQRHPRLVKAVVIVDGPGPSTDGGARQRRMAEALGRDDYADQVRHAYRGFFMPTTDRRDVERWADEAARTPQHVSVGNMLGGSRADIARIAKRIKQPALYINATGPYSAASVREWLPQAEFAQVIASGHFPQVEVPEQVNPILQSFIDRL